MALLNEIEALRLVYYHEMMAIPMDRPREETGPMLNAVIRRFVERKREIEARYPKKPKSGKAAVLSEDEE